MCMQNNLSYYTNLLATLDLHCLILILILILTALHCTALHSNIVIIFIILCYLVNSSLTSERDRWYVGPTHDVISQSHHYHHQPMGVSGMEYNTDTYLINLSSPLPSLARTVIPSHERMTNDLSSAANNFFQCPATFDQPPPSS